ncbi:MAG: hypothetical protein HY816_19035 [Candidatus Wallbacteria bacterium]|nr:hypothetical protein [Candidatus Wallbacteria bacterium]
MMNLHPSELEALASLIEAILPGMGAGEDLASRYGRFLEALGPVRGLGLRIAVRASAAGLPAVMLGRWARLGALGQQEREECVSRLLSHRRYLVRQVGLLLKVACCTIALQEPRTRERLGLPPVARPDRPRGGA